MNKKVSRSTVAADMKYMGAEPIFNDQTLSEVDLLHCFDWYNRFKTSDDAQQYIEQFAKRKLAKIDTNTYGWLARMATRGAQLPPHVQQKLQQYVEQSTARMFTQNNDNRPVQTSNRESKLSIWLPDFEHAVDNFETTDFNPYEYISSNEIGRNYIQEIKRYYEPIVEEVENARSKTDKQLVEGYKCFTSTQLKKLHQLLKLIVDDCDRSLDNRKREYKQRKPRKKSTESILKHFKYLSQSETLKISSESPEKILGAKVAYLLNTKTNTLTMFVGQESGLNIHRSSISQFDPSKSFTKKLGKRTASIVVEIVNSTCMGRSKIFNNISTKPMASVAERSNEHTLILKVDK